MSKEILCTLGPASMNDLVISRLEDLGVTLFRINLSHTPLDDVADAIRFITSRTKVPLSLDTEGAQIRTGNLVEPVLEMRESAIARAHRDPVPGDAENFNFYPLDIIKEFQTGDLISIDFNAVLVQVIEEGEDAITMRILNSGQFGRNKAVTVDRPIALPALTEKDRAAVQIGVDLGIKDFALSFANSGADVDSLRDLTGKDARIISKIECRNGFENLGEIAERSDALLIDRGDLSREVPIELIPAYQKTIIEKARAHGRKVYVATNLLESMVTEPVPTRAEVNDIYNTFLDGADGIVLAAETAIGQYPIQCANMVAKMINVFENQGLDDDGRYHLDPVSLLVEPHGGGLVHGEAGPADLKGLDGLPRLRVSETDLLDCEQIALGTYSPLRGFMDRATLESVLAENRLADGTVWTMPVILQCGADDVSAFGPGERIALTDDRNEVMALLDVSEVYPLETDSVIERWFGTATRDHPGVRRILDAGECCVAGEVTLVERRPTPHRHFELSPAQTRFIFTHKGWSQVVGFHTRNVCHRVHEYIQIQALEQTNADGLYVSPVIGPKKAGDFLPEPIMKSYQSLLESGVYPRGQMVLGSFATYSRYCGPREAVFTALCRKNMGCSHFVIGRDHTGVGDYYDSDANHRVFDDLGDIGITPVFFDVIGYDPDKECYTALSGGGSHLTINGTEVRESIRRGERLPDWFMRDFVQNMLFDEIAAGQPVFYQEPTSET
jgi:ATP sulfurylase|tara:strand:+ start:3407 stop:5590 length:2184 start_codon:yes stop_codon:yes gene_type:complete